MRMNGGSFSPAPQTDSGSPLSLKPSDCSTPPSTVKLEPFKYVAPWTLMYKMYKHLSYNEHNYQSCMFFNSALFKFLCIGLQLMGINLCLGDVNNVRLCEEKPRMKHETK